MGDEKKQKVVIFLESEEVKDLDIIAGHMTKLRAKNDEEKGVPPSKRGRRISRSKTARILILEAMKTWDGENQN